MSKAIEAAIHAGSWKKARRLIRAKLRRFPEDHWLLTRLGVTYYEEENYQFALKYEKLALHSHPKCPLVLWDYAGTLQMLGKHRSALGIYNRLVSRGVTSIAYGDCGEGRARARGLVADCLYRRALSYGKLGARKAAIRSLVGHLRMRGPGCRSIYTLKIVRKELLKLRRSKRPIAAVRRIE